ncbi:unnamed protein product, partial [Rotaria magnacalcarata]
YPTLHKVPNDPNGLYYSDHLAVYALFEIDENAPEKKVKRREDFEIVDEETQALLRSACGVVEETIQRLQRERIFFALGIF